MGTALLAGITSFTIIIITVVMTGVATTVFITMTGMAILFMASIASTVIVVVVIYTVTKIENPFWLGFQVLNLKLLIHSFYPTLRFPVGIIK